MSTWLKPDMLVFNVTGLPFKISKIIRIMKFLAPKCLWLKRKRPKLQKKIFNLKIQGE